MAEEEWLDPSTGLTSPSTGAEGTMSKVNVEVTGSCIPSSKLNVMVWIPMLNRDSNINQSSPSGVSRPSRSLVHVTTKNSEPPYGENGAQCHVPSSGKVSHAASKSPEPFAENSTNSDESKVVNDGRGDGGDWERVLYSD